jgi:beta-lactamase superfamily II metal-dependent hydrolase
VIDALDPLSAAESNDAMRKAKRAKSASRPAVKRSASDGARFMLLGNEALGGHRARKGFRFQDLWLAFHLLNWVSEDDFYGFVNEGMDDVDACWLHGGRGAQNPAARDWRIHQLKDTTITPKLLSEIFDAFRRKEASIPAAWSGFHVIATRCAERLNSLPVLLDLTRKYLITHGRDSPVADAAIVEFAETLERLGVSADASFVVDRVELKFNAGWVGDADTFSPLFNAKLAGYGIARERLEEAGRALVALVSGEKVGGLVKRAEVTALLDGFKPTVDASRKPVAAELPLASAGQRRAPARAVRDESALVSVFPGGGVLLRLPGGAHGLVDCGMDAASQIISYLAERKVETLDFVAISHWHIDRYNGVLSVASAVKRVRRLWVPSFPGKLDPFVARKFRDQLESGDLRRYGIAEIVETNARLVIWQLPGDTGGTARVEAFAADMNDRELHRTLKRWGNRVENINDFCTVFRVSVGSRSFLICADATIKCWTDLFKRLVGPDESMRCDGLTVPHHGSSRSLNRDILGAIAEPSGFYAVVDPDPRFRLPHREALDLVRAANGEILVCDSTPVHLLLARDGLFERRFALSRPGTSSQ